MQMEYLNNSFLETYINSISKSSELIYGGILYHDNSPSHENLLRWLYGKKREALNAELRNKNKYLRFLTLSFLIKKNVFNKVKFNEDIPNNRHEDTLFAYDLKKANINLKHIDNPVYHLGLESSKTFLEKSLLSVEAILVMPSVMWKLSLVYLFQWYALFCYWQNSAKSIALSVWKVTPSSDPAAYQEAVGWAGLVNGWYNIVTFLSAFFLVGLAQKFGAKKVHFFCLLLAGVGLLIFPMLENKYALFIPMTGFGIAWASMMGIPYLLVVNEIPKERYGVYMGIINMMIVIPMLFQTTTFGYILKNFCAICLFSKN